MSLLRKILPGILIVASSSLATAQNSCDALLQHGLSDITTSFGAGHSIVTNYQRHCGSIDASTSNRTVAEAGFEIFGYFGGSGDADVQRTLRRIETWCNTNSDFAQANSTFFEEARHINSAAVQAYEACQQFNRRDIDITVQRDNEIARNVTITIDSTSDGEYRFLGVVSREYACQYFISKDANSARTFVDLKSTVQVDIPIKNDNIHITCARMDAEIEEISDGIKRLSYKHGSIQVLTSGPAMQLEFPEVVETHFATPRGTIIPVLGRDCPAGWHPLKQAEGRFLLGASEDIALSSIGGKSNIPKDGSHSHKASTSDNVMRGAHPNGMTMAPGPHRHLHGHNVNIAESGSHNHGGVNMPPYLAVTYCHNS